MRRNCMYRINDRWVKGVIVGECITGWIFKKKQYLVEVTKLDIWNNSKPYVENRLFDEKDIVIEKLENPQTVKHKYGCHQNGETEFCDDCMAIDLCSRRYSVVLKQKGGN